jgi:signal transduction histidine kinase
VRLRIKDDGVGLTDEALAKPKSHGVVGMRERMREMGGTFAIRRPSAGRGTVVDAFIPNPRKTTSSAA